MIDIELLLAYGGTYRNFKKGDFIYHEGMEPLFYYQLVTGQIKMVSEVPSGKVCILDYMQPGDALGLTAIMQKTPYLMTALAYEDCVVTRLEKHMFHALLSDHPGQMNCLLIQLTRQLKFQTLLIKELHDHSSLNRVKTFMDYVMRENKFMCPSTKMLLLTRQQIAELTGLRVETVIRAIRNLHHQRHIQIKRGKIYSNEEQEIGVNI